MSRRYYGHRPLEASVDIIVAIFPPQSDMKSALGHSELTRVGLSKAKAAPRFSLAVPR